MTVADLAAGALVVLATGLVGWACVRSDVSLAAFLPPLLAGGSLLAFQVRSWRRALRQPPRRLVARGDGSLWLHTTGQAPARATVGAGARLLGSSVFLDLTVGSNRAGERLCAWLTPFDVPPQSLRRWRVLLRRSGRVVCS